jgi:hypothetical protein
MSVSGHQELVFLFDAEEQICGEIHFSVFNRHLNGDGRLDGCAASVTKAAYCVVGDGLRLRGVAFFQFSVDEEGRVDPAFNLPLRYLVQHAGLAEELGQGPVRKASRSQCPVPWHAVNLWEPQAPDALETPQNRIFRNRLKLLSSTACRDDEFFPPSEDSLELFDNTAAPGDAFVDEETVRPLPAPRAANPVQGNGQSQQFAGRLNEVFGADGKLSMQDMIRLHTEQLDEAKSRYREQLNAYRDEINELKVALRQEQGRSRRLQELLRGDL